MNTCDEDYTADYLAVARGDKPLMICEKRKAPLTYAMIKRLTSLFAAPDAFDIMLADGDGRNRAALVVTRKANDYHYLLDLLANRERFTRAQFQMSVGELLGHTPESCQEFSDSKIGKSCECELCGGADESTRRHNRADHDAHVRRTMFYL